MHCSISATRIQQLIESKSSTHVAQWFWQVITCTRWAIYGDLVY